MDLPQPPEDTELRNIIDKLAQFVARNGPEFEQMTKNKQKGNPKFQFLYGGEHFNYYQYKVTSEQAVFKQQQQQGITMPEPSWTTPPPPCLQTVEIDHIIQQQETLREQIKQSEQNLSAQHAVLMQQQQASVEAMVAKCEAADLQKAADECGVSLNELHSILQPIIDSCTKDSISNGKSWFLQHATTKEKSYCIVKCLLYNARKNANDLKEALEIAVVPMFCNASIAATEEQKLKLHKLVKLWESKANYLQADTLDMLRNPVQSYQQYRSDQMAKYATEVSVLIQQTKVTFEGYQSQHQAFVCHAMQQIMDLQQQKQNLEQKGGHHVQQEVVATAPTATTTNTNIIPLETIQATLQQTIQTLTQSNNIVATAPSTPQQTFPSTPQQTFPSTPQQTFPSTPQQTFPIQTIGCQNDPVVSASSDNLFPMNLNIPPPNLLGNQQDGPPPPLPPPPPSSNGVGLENPFSLPPPGFLPPPGMFPDFSRPPPGFPAPPIKAAELFLEELMPTAPYYDLPAGLMVPLVKLEDSEYRPLDPKDIRLPPPAPPSERLLAAVDAFYSLPSHERPRDSEGWEKLGLYEYYKAKNQAKREKEDAIRAGLRLKSKSPSPIILKTEKEPTPQKRRYRSKSPTPPRPATPQHHRGGRDSRSRRSRSKSRSRSRSRSPTRRRRGGRDRGEARESRRRKSYSPRPRSRSKSRSPPPPRRSPSPMAPGFGGGSPFMRNEPQELDSSNKGHEMLRKMGWGGKGLGANEQGIDAPISGGDVRDRQDQFKGVGCNMNDPYENFRKNKGAAFITRMKARAEEREKDKDAPPRRSSETSSS